MTRHRLHNLHMHVPRCRNLKSTAIKVGPRRAAGQAAIEVAAEAAAGAAARAVTHLAGECADLWHIC